MTRVLCLTLAALLGAGCTDDDWGPEKLGLGQSSAAAGTLAKGRAVYATYCVGCHGEQGDGSGPAARFMKPAPRDLRVGRLKFAQVPAGSVPHDEDYLRTINRGLAGTAMPGFALIPEDDKAALVIYVRSFYQGEPEAPAPPVVLPDDPFTAEPEKGIAEGARVYHGIAQCFTCHAAYLEKPQIALALKSFNLPFDGAFREGLYDSVEKESEWGAPIRPPDFLLDRVKSGSSRRNLARVIATGVGGTAMPAWGSGLEPEQLWGLAYYVESLVALRATPAAAALRAKLAAQPAAAPDLAQQHPETANP